MCAARDKKPGFDSEFSTGRLKIKLRGEIDHHSAVALRTSIDDMIRSKRPAELLIDMSAVDFMDSSGLGLIMGRYSVMQEIGGEIFVCDPNPSTERIMNLAGMERIIKIKHTLPREKDKTVARCSKNRGVHRTAAATKSVPASATAKAHNALENKKSDDSSKRGEIK